MVLSLATGATGLEYAMARQNLSKDIEDVKAKMEAMEQLFSRSISELQQTVAVLTADSDKYKHIRQQFLSTFKRNQLCACDTRLLPAADRKWIGSGNVLGDYLFDARLFTGRGARSCFYRNLWVTVVNLRK